MSVQPFKCGPDYIDPAFHAAASGRPSYNIDSWAMRKETAGAVLQSARGADFLLFEALMGLFDGVASPGAWGTGSSADIAALAGCPAVLVLDISGQSQSAAAAARGFRDFRPGVEIAGVILNRVGSPRHEKLARAAFDECGLRVYGAIPRKEKIELPERHLGLVQAGETEGLEAKLDALAALAEAHLDIDGLIKLAAAPLSSLPAGNTPLKALSPPAQRIALAQDAAFSFVYPHILKAWREAGTEILPFSPLADEAPDPNADLLWLPGGYPELHAGHLSGNLRFLNSAKAFARIKPIHGECGGYMVLGEAIIDHKGNRHAMLGLLGLETSFEARKLHLGYRRAVLRQDCALGGGGEIVAGHEFHYASVMHEPDEKLFDIFDADGTPLTSAGGRRGNVTGSFFHFVDRMP